MWNGKVLKQHCSKKVGPCIISLSTQLMGIAIWCILKAILCASHAWDERLTTVGAQVPHWHRGLKRCRCILGLLLMHLRERQKSIRKLCWIIKLFEYVVTTHLVHVYSVQAHLGWCKLWRQGWIRLAEHPGVTCRHANEKVTSITSESEFWNREIALPLVIISFLRCYLSPTVWSLQYTVSSCCCRDDRRVCERDRPAWGCWDDERDARTLAAAEAALLGGTKRRFLPGSPEAVSTEWANTLANRLSGWRAKIMQNICISLREVKNELASCWGRCNPADADGYSLCAQDYDLWNNQSGSKRWNNAEA